MNTDLVRYEAGAVARVVLDDPPMNLLRPEMLEKLGDSMEEALGDERVRVIVLTGEGNRAFTAGFDINVFTEVEDASGAEDLASTGQAITVAIESAHKPVNSRDKRVVLGRR